MGLSAYVRNNSKSLIIVTVRDLGPSTVSPLLNNVPLAPTICSRTFNVQDEGQGKGRVEIFISTDPSDKRPVTIETENQEISWVK